MSGRGGTRGARSGQGRPITDIDHLDEVAPCFQGLQDLQRAEAQACFEAQRARRLLAGERALVASLTHELRNPLAAARAHLQLLGERRDAAARLLQGEPVRSNGPPRSWTRDADSDALLAQVRPLLDHIAVHLANAARATARAQRLADELFDYVRLKRHQLLIQPQSIALAAFINKVAEQMAPLLAGRPVAHTPLFGSPVVLADPERLQQVLANLLDNCGKYTPPSTSLRFSACHFDPAVERLPWRWPPSKLARPWVLLTYQDDGPGVPAVMRPRLFKPFCRRPSDGIRRQGLGLGLYLCRRLCRAHGGEMWLEDKAPGATFCMLWPAASPLLASPR